MGLERLVLLLEQKRPELPAPVGLEQLRLFQLQRAHILLLLAPKVQLIVMVGILLFRQ